MGMQAAFSADAADFSALSVRPTFVSDVLQSVRSVTHKGCAELHAVLFV